MDAPRDCHTELCKSNKDNYHMVLLICVIFKNGTNELILKNRVTDIEYKLMITRRERVGEGGIIGRLGFTYTHYSM